MHYFCLDIGGTHTRGTLFGAEGEVLGTAKAGGGAISLGVETTERAIRDVWAQLDVGADNPVPDKKQCQIVGGLAGIGLRDRVNALRDNLSDFSDAQFVCDGYGALLQATGGQPGAMIAVGTGVAAMRLMADGTTRTISGWGFPGGDLGSGAWIGLKAIGALTKYLDGSIEAPLMSAHLADRLQQVAGNTPMQIMDWLTSGRAGQYAKLAPAVIQSAGEGDPFACAVLDAAATEIVDVARCLFDNVPDQVVLTGGLGAVHLPRCQALTPEFTWTHCHDGAVHGLYLMASKQAPAEKIIARPRTPYPDY